MKSLRDYEEHANKINESGGKMEQGKPVSKYGLWIDPEEIKKHSYITVWGQMLMKDHTIGPWVPILDLPIDRDRIKEYTTLIGTYISLE